MDLDDDMLPRWTRYTRLNRFFNMTDLAREYIALERELGVDIKTYLEGK